MAEEENVLEQQTRQPKQQATPQSEGSGRAVEKKLKGNVDIRLLYILPSLLALVIAITALAFQFGNEIVDLNNTHYTYYISVPDGTDPNDFLLELADTIDDYDVTGITMSVAEAGGSKHGDRFELDPSIQISMMDVSKKEASRIAHGLSDKYGKKVLFEESVVEYVLIAPGE